MPKRPQARSTSSSTNQFIDDPHDNQQVLGIDVLGVDIGGANLKLATADGRATAMEFPMWTDHQRLGPALRSLIDEFQAAEQWHARRLAVTMTGELADCFASRRLGVAAILHQVAQAFAAEQTLVYAVGGEWLSLAAAERDPWRVAASNWYALAEWTLQTQPIEEAKIAAVVDIGSTTVDIVPLAAGQIATAARTDRQRLQLGQLIYTGMQRTPVAAILNCVNLDGLSCPLMAERFATSDDAYLALGLTTASADSDESACGETADGRSRTFPNACARLARMVGEDLETLPTSVILDIATQIVDAQARQVAQAIDRNLSQLSQLHQWSNLGHLGPTLLVSGHGRPLIERAQAKLSHACQLMYLEERLAPAAARCAPAVAVAWLLEAHLEAERKT